MKRTRIMLLPRHAKLSDQFGYDYAVRLFGQAAIDSLPLLASGPNKGAPKGYLHWRKAMSAGYVPECAGACKEGGLVDAWIGEGMGTPRDSALRGLWCGREQGLAGSRSVLTPEYREQEERRAAEYLAETDALRRRIEARGNPCGATA